MKVTALLAIILASCGIVAGQEKNPPLSFHLSKPVELKPFGGLSNNGFKLNSQEAFRAELANTGVRVMPLRQTEVKRFIFGFLLEQERWYSIDQNDPKNFRYEVPRSQIRWEFLKNWSLSGKARKPTLLRPGMFEISIKKRF